MSAHETSATDQQLLRDLLDGLGGRADRQQLTVGIVGHGKHAPQPPGHCLRTCLGGDPAAVDAHGCPFLRSAARNDADAALLADGRCPQGFQVAVRGVVVSGLPATLLTVAGSAPGAAPTDPEPLLQGHLEAAGRLLQRVDQLLEENAGFANEVLQNYEQLNLIFDLTQQIFQITDVQAIERLLLERVGRLLSAGVIHLITSDDEHRVYAMDGAAASPPQPDFGPRELATAVDFVRRTRQVHVRLVGRQRVIAGPLVRLDDKVDVVLATRRPGQTDFHSGDMMLVESVLAFGGQIISNTELHERLRRMSLEVTRAMVAAIDKKDHYTSGHSERVGFLTRLVAAELGVSPAAQQTMEWAGLLHDVGKIGIPEEILCKPGRLTAEEFEVIKQHPRMGYEILKPIASLGVILDGILSHHEYPDGSGYPNGLAGEDIPLVARIIHVADTFDALTSTRSYRQAFSIEKAFEIIREESGTRIDAGVAEAFFRAFERYRREDRADFAQRFARILEREVEHASC